MAATLEREIKLRFDSAAEARAAVLAAGAAPARIRRLQEDCLLDTADNQLRQRRCALRVRMESGKGLLTFKGPVQPSIEKVRFVCVAMNGAPKGGRRPILAPHPGRRRRNSKCGFRVIGT